MAKGKQKHQDYLDALSLLGKDLARRAKSKCELSGAPGSLKTYDLEDSSIEPSLDHVILVSHEVFEHLEGRHLEDRNALRYLEEAVWNPNPAIRRAACSILERIDEPWAQTAIENAQSMSQYDD